MARQSLSAALVLDTHVMPPSSLVITRLPVPVYATATSLPVGVWNPVPAFAHRGDVDVVVRIWRVDAGGGEDHVSRLTGTRAPTCAAASLRVAGRDGVHWFAIAVPVCSLHWKQSTLEPETCFIFEI